MSSVNCNQYNYIALYVATHGFLVTIVNLDLKHPFRTPKLSVHDYKPCMYVLLYMLCIYNIYVGHHDEGVYTCTALNSLGLMATQTKLIVLGHKILGLNIPLKKKRFNFTS